MPSAGNLSAQESQAIALRALVSDNFDELERVYDERYEKRHSVEILSALVSSWWFLSTPL